MTEDKMYDYMRSEMRSGITALEALSRTLVKAGAEIKPFSKADNHLYIKCDKIPSTDINIIDFLAYSNGLVWRIVADLNIVHGQTIAVPYINVYKKV